MMRDRARHDPVIRGMNITAPIITTIALALVAATPAAASVNPDLPKPGDPQYAIPVGKVEHSITVSEVSGSKAVPSRQRVELWLSRNRGRVVVTNLKTGKVTTEIVVTNNETRAYSAETRRVTVRKTRPGERLPWNSARFEAAVQRAYVEQGITKVTGETTVRGRRAFVVENVPGTWVSDQPDSKTIAIVDAETYELYERTSTLPNGEFTQKESTQTFYGAPARFTMSTHKGTKVRYITH
jgi:outer membrane lipoprotein-sorting protein